MSQYFTCIHSKKSAYNPVWFEWYSGRIFSPEKSFEQMKEDDDEVYGKTSHVNVFVILVPWLGAGSWYQSSCLLLQVTSGTMNWTSLGTSLHSCQVTGSQVSVPAHIYDGKKKKNWFRKTDFWHCTCPPLSSVSQRVTQFCLVTFLHSGRSFWWGIVFWPWKHDFSVKSFGVSFFSEYSCVSNPILQSV